MFMSYTKGLKKRRFAVLGSMESSWKSPRASGCASEEEQYHGRGKQNTPEDQTHTTEVSHTSRTHDVTRTHAPIFVVLLGVTHHCCKALHVGKTVHCARCPRRWVGPLHTVPWPTPPVTGPGSSHREVERSGKVGGTGTTGTSQP